MRTIYNAKLRTRILRSGLTQKQICEYLRWSESKLSRLLRFPMTTEQVELVNSAIDELLK